MKPYFDFIEKVPYAGAKSKNPFTFRYYDADRVVMGKPMKEQLSFAMSWWHTLGADGVDMFGKSTANKTFCCAVPGAWHVMGVTQGAGLSLQWFKNQFCAEEIQRAQQENRSVYALLDEAAKQVPIGAEKLFYLPYLMGECTPHLDPDCRGVFFGISAKHTRAHFVRAVMEGVSYSLYDCLCVIHETGINPAAMLITGGGGASVFWRQMLCDLFALPVKTAESTDGAALGVAVLAAVGAGIYENVPSACKTMVKYNPDTQQPDDARRTAEYRHFHAFYDSLYGALKDRFCALASL